MKKLLKALVVALTLPLLITSTTHAQGLNFKYKIALAKYANPSTLVLINKSNLADMSSAINLIRNGSALYLYDKTTSIESVIEDLKPKDVKILGSYSSIPKEVDKYIFNKHIHLERYNERNRYLTNKKTINTKEVIGLKDITLNNILIASNLAKYSNLSIELNPKSNVKYKIGYGRGNTVYTIDKTISLLKPKTKINIENTDSLMNLNKLFTKSKVALTSIKPIVKPKPITKKITTTTETVVEPKYVPLPSRHRYTSIEDKLLSMDDNKPHIWKTTHPDLYKTIVVNNTTYPYIDSYEAYLSYVNNTILLPLDFTPRDVLMPKDFYHRAKTVVKYVEDTPLADYTDGTQLYVPIFSRETYTTGEGTYVKVRFIPQYLFHDLYPTLNQPSQVERFKKFRANVNNLLINSRALYKTTKEAQVYALCNYINHKWLYNDNINVNSIDTMAKTGAYDAVFTANKAICQGFASVFIEACRQLGIMAYGQVVDNNSHIVVVVNLGTKENPVYKVIDPTSDTQAPPNNIFYNEIFTNRTYNKSIADIINKVLQ